MRSDRADRAGGSAAQRYRAARRLTRRRRAAQIGALAAGAASAVWSAARLSAGWWSAGPLLVALVVGVAARSDRDPGRWARGAAGEGRTAALLGELPGRRWAVFHDRVVPGHAANLDHVAIGPTGVWMIDTKTYRAPIRAGWRSVRAGSHGVDTGPAAWEAAVVADALGVDARPLLAVHGSGLPRRGRRVAGVRVLPADAVVSRLRRRRGSARLRRRDVEALAAEFDRCFPPAVHGPGPSGRREGRPVAVPSRASGRRPGEGS